MTTLIAGLVLFLGVHSVRIFADPWRAGMIARLGAGPWKAVYSLLSIAGFVLIVRGYAAARAAPVDVWTPPSWLMLPASLLMLAAMVLLVSAYVPGNRIKGVLRHPMILGVKVWALAHLLSNGRLADVLLFGAFLAWAVLDFRAARVRDRAGAPPPSRGGLPGTVAAVVIGVIVWFAFARYLHAWLIGVAPLGGA